MLAPPPMSPPMSPPMPPPTPPPADAPWRAAFLSQVGSAPEAPTFVLSTLHRRPSGQWEPRARTVVFRGMWASLPANSKNPAARNPDVYRTDMPTITTDARMEKVPELLLPPGQQQPPPQSGAGGPVEAVFWAREARTQWRLRGRAYVAGSDIDSDAGAPVRDALAPRMRSADPRPSPGWSWARELTAHFGNLSPIMRGTFRNPPPGKPLSWEPVPGDGLGLGQTVDDLDDEVARRNFRVVIIVPDEVDRVDLSEPHTGRRWLYSYTGAGDAAGAWETTELWP